jgi:hypothetical protein
MEKQTKELTYEITLSAEKYLQRLAQARKESRKETLDEVRKIIDEMTDGIGYIYSKDIKGKLKSLEVKSIMEKQTKEQDTKRKICNRFEKVFKEDGFCWQDFNKSLDDAEKIGRTQLSRKEKKTKMKKIKIKISIKSQKEMNKLKKKLGFPEEPINPKMELECLYG